jgi:hypothetical protein
VKPIVKLKDAQKVFKDRGLNSTSELGAKFTVTPEARMYLVAQIISDNAISVPASKTQMHNAYINLREELGIGSDHIDQAASDRLLDELKSYGIFGGGSGSSSRMLCPVRSGNDTTRVRQ